MAINHQLPPLNIPIYGVNAKAHINYPGTIYALAKIIAKGMILPDFHFKTDQDPPHEITGHCQALGSSL